MKKVTKKPKGVIVYWKECQSFNSVYNCPSCGTEFQGFVGSENITRFKCQCGQELIINKHIYAGAKP